MTDNSIFNKYFIIALIIALLVLLYLYSRKKSCQVEGMKNIDFSPLSNQIEKPWAENDNDGKYKKVKSSKKKSKNNKTKRSNNGMYKTFIEYDLYENIVPDNSRQNRKRIDLDYDNIPRPLDDRPDLSQCQPCICPKNKNSVDSDDSYESDESDESNDYQANRRKKLNNK